MSHMLQRHPHPVDLPHMFVFFLQSIDALDAKATLMPDFSAYPKLKVRDLFLLFTQTFPLVT